MNISGNYLSATSWRAKSTNTKKRTTNFSQTDSFQKQINFKGQKSSMAKAALGGVAAGMAISYYLIASAILPAGINKTVNDGISRQFEQRAILAADAPSTDKEKQLLVDDIIKLTEKAPKESVTAKTVKMIKDYNLVDSTNSAKIQKALEKALENKNLDQNAAKIYTEVIEKIK